MPPEPEQTIDFRLHPSKRAGDATLAAQAGRLPRITQLMALAISFQEMLRTGDAPSYAAMARANGVTAERFSQVMQLVWLAPDIQAEVLELPPCAGRHPLTEHALRLIARHLCWDHQRSDWRPLKGSLHLE